MATKKTLKPPYTLSPDAQLLQGEEWQAFQTALGHTIFENSGRGWHYVAILRKRRYGNYLEVPYGPTIKTTSALAPAIASLRKLAKEQKAVFIRIEPIGKVSATSLKSVGAKRARKNFQPEFTLKLHLNPGVDQLRKKLSKGRKSALKIAEKHLEIREGTSESDLQIFLDMLHQTTSRLNISPHSDQYYKTMVHALAPSKSASVFVAEHHGKPVAAAICLDSPTTRYYLHAASYPEARDTEAATGIVWQMITGAKEKGLVWFDFFGIAPPNQPNHPWVGFTRFKKSFDGEVIERSGTWEIPVIKSKYLLLSATIKARQFIKR